MSAEYLMDKANSIELKDNIQRVIQGKSLKVKDANQLLKAIFAAMNLTLTFYKFYHSKKYHTYEIRINTYIVGCRGASQPGGSLLGIPPRV